jgi:chemotaxis protein MotB
MSEHNDADEPLRVKRQLEQQIQILQLQLTRSQRAGDVKQHLLRRQQASHMVYENSEEDSWLTVYLDMLTLLLVLLVVMLTFAGKADSPTYPPTSNPLTSERTQSIDLIDPPLPQPIPSEQQPDTRSTDPLAGLDTSGLGQDIEVIVNDQSVSFRISSEIIFAPAQAELSLEGLAVLRQLIPVLRSSEYPLTIAGHTDDRPIRSLRYPSNWELSGARAGSVVRYLEANGIPSARLSAVGHADTRPLKDNDTVDGRASNRRVELTLEKN